VQKLPTKLANQPSLHIWHVVFQKLPYYSIHLVITTFLQCSRSKQKHPCVANFPHTVFRKWALFCLGCFTQCSRTFGQSCTGFLGSVSGEIDPNTACDPHTLLIKFFDMLMWMGLIFKSRVSDPHWFNADPDTDPDPAFFLFVDPDSGSGSGYRVWWPKIEKNYSWKKISFFLIKNYNLPIPRPP